MAPMIMKGVKSMKESHLRLLALTVLLFTGVALVVNNQPTTRASDARDYLLGWQVIGFGGGVSSGGEYTLSSTVGQATAGELTGGNYTLGGGFWGGGARIVAEVTPTATATATMTPEEPTPTMTPTPEDPVDNADEQLYLPLVAR
jgi:hypothetical protein